jgi:DNA-binding IclR family transcriptional regulator
MDIWMLANDTGVGVLDRSVAILEAIDGGARTFTAIVHATELTRTTAHRLLRSLEAHGFAMQIDGYGYALGPKLLNLAARAGRGLPLRELAHPSLEQLARATGESAQLYQREGDARRCVDTAESERELRTIVRVGALLPLTKGSAGTVLLAWGPPPGDEEIDDALAGRILMARRRGWADSHGEREPGVSSISAPVFGGPGELLAAVSVSGPQTRLSASRARRYAPAVIDAAHAIEQAMGVQR